VWPLRAGARGFSGCRMKTVSGQEEHAFPRDSYMTVTGAQVNLGFRHSPHFNCCMISELTQIQNGSARPLHL
jgi:hypothetical protein